MRHWGVGEEKVSRHLWLPRVGLASSPAKSKLDSPWTSEPSGQPSSFAIAASTGLLFFARLLAALSLFFSGFPRFFLDGCMILELWSQMCCETTVDTLILISISPAHENSLHWSNLVHSESRMTCMRLTTSSMNWRPLGFSWSMQIMGSKIQLKHPFSYLTDHRQVCRLCEARIHDRRLESGLATLLLCWEP